MAAKRILVVEDDPHIADVVEYVLIEHGFSVTRAADGDAGKRRFTESPPDLVLLDLNLPGIPGLDLFQLMRRLRPEIPVIMLTSRTDEADRVAGLEMGADDYVTKPFSTRELAARVRAVLRRNHRAYTAERRFFTAGPLAVDSDQLSVTYFGQPVDVTNHEFKILQSLVRYPARVFPRDVLIDALYDGQGVVTDRSIDAQVKRLRKKLAAIRPDIDPIQTVYGMGYKIRQSLEDIP